MNVNEPRVSFVKNVQSSRIKHFDCRDCIYSKKIFIAKKIQQMEPFEQFKQMDPFEPVEPIELVEQVNEPKQVCILFRYNYLNENPYIETNICRSDSNLCGKHGEYFTSKDYLK